MSWEDIERDRRLTAEQRRAIEAEQREMARLCASVFGSGDGRELLSRLRRMTLETVLGSAASDSALRHHEGRRSLVRQIETWIARANAPGEHPSA